MRRSATLLSSTWFLAACGGLVVFERDDGQSGEGGDDPVTTSAATAGAGGDALHWTVEDTSFGADCMPFVGPDPLSAHVTVRYVNGSIKAASVEIVEARLAVLIDGENLVVPLTLVPASSGEVAPGETKVVDHTKAANSGADTQAICGFCGGVAKLFVTWKKPGGEEEERSFNAAVGCVQ